jgi:hypothetical protein
MDKEADPVRLLQREDRLPEWKQRYQTNHSSAEVRTAHGTAAKASQAGCRLAVHFPSTPKKTSAQEKSAH